MEAAVLRNRIFPALAAALALPACTPDAAERVTGPAASVYVHDSAPPVPVRSVAGDSTTVESAEGGNAFGSGT